MAPAKKRTPKRRKGTPPKDESLSFDTLSRLGRQFNIPVLAGISKEAVAGLPANTIFATVTDQHWLLCIKGEHKLVVFDSLGLPLDTLTKICKGIPIEPWNKYGYQSMFGTVCGYYVVAALIFIQHGHTMHNADIDRLFMEICKTHATRPPTISRWYQYHRHHDVALRRNDSDITDFVLSIYPHLGWIDHHSSHLGARENHSGLIGSPLYRRAGIHAPSVHQQFDQLNSILTNDPQKQWLGLGESTIATVPEKLQVVDGRAIAYETAATKRDTNAAIARGERMEGRRQRFLHTAGPHPGRRMTPAERTLWARAALNAFDAPSGVTAAGNQRGAEPERHPHNVVEDEEFADAV